MKEKDKAEDVSEQMTSCEQGSFEAKDGKQADESSSKFLHPSLSLSELLSLITSLEDFKRLEHMESLEKCKKNTLMLSHYNQLPSDPAAAPLQS